MGEGQKGVSAPSLPSMVLDRCLAHFGRTVAMLAYLQQTDPWHRVLWWICSATCKAMSEADARIHKQGITTRSTSVAIRLWVLPATSGAPVSLTNAKWVVRKVVSLTAAIDNLLEFCECCLYN